VISALKLRRPDARGIILTGYGNIATAVNAVKLGAVDYLESPPMPTTSWRLCWRMRTDALSRRKIQCRLTACAGAHSAHLRIVRTQCLGNRAAAHMHRARCSGFWRKELRVSQPTSS